jgi:pyruvate kinase
VGWEVYEATGPESGPYPECRALVSVELPRFVDPPVRLELVVRHEATPAAVRHVVELQAACRLAARLDVAVIATITRDGKTERLAAKYRPQPPILAVTPQLVAFRRLALVRGVVPVLLPTSGETPEAMVAARAVAQEHGWGGRPGSSSPETWCGA